MSLWWGEAPERPDVFTTPPSFFDGSRASPMRVPSRDKPSVHLYPKVPGAVTVDPL
jgi:hypothetical protein